MVAVVTVHVVSAMRFSEVTVTGVTVADTPMLQDVEDVEDVEDEDEAAGKPIMNRNDISIKSFSQDVWRILTYW